MRRGPGRQPARRDVRKPEGAAAAAPHARDLIRVAGMPAVAGLFARAPERVERLFFLPALRRAAEPFATALTRAHKPWREVDGEELQRVAGSAMHGGIVAIARPRPLAGFDATATAAKPPPLLLILDGIGNPQNLGAIARTAAYFGLDRLVLSDHKLQATPSDAAYRIAEGGLDQLELQRATRLPATLRRLAEGGMRVVATALGRGRPLAELRRDKPIALLLGNEERGLDGVTLAACDELVTIPGGGAVQSLNVSAAAAILIHALRRP